jgi:hypothetical protein
MGHALINPQLIADQFAANGYWTVMPDLFQGDAIELNQLGGGDFDIMKWLTKGGPEGKGHLPDTVDPIVEKTLAYMKEQGAKKIGAVGYCFGGKYVARFLAKGKGVDVGFTAHPSFVDEAELRGMTGPLSIAAAGKLRTKKTSIGRTPSLTTSQKPTPSSPKRSVTSLSRSSRTWVPSLTRWSCTPASSTVSLSAATSRTPRSSSPRRPLSCKPSSGSTSSSRRTARARRKCICL